MSLIEILVIAVSMALDACAVSLAVGTAGHAQGLRSRLRMAFHFGLFQGLMPILGWMAGTQVVHLIADYDHWVAMGLLGYVGVQMIISGLDPDGDGFSSDPSRGRMLVLLCVATSIDALAIGLSLGVLRVPIWFPSITIAAVTAALSLTALMMGGLLGKQFGKRMEIVGGLLLNGIGLRILASHLLWI